VSWDPSAALPIIDRLWWYTSLGATAIVTEEATALIGGLAAHDGHIRLLTAGFSVSAGSWGADIILYYLGRWRGRWVRRRFPGARRVMLRALTLVRRHPWRSSIAVRWAYGLRLTLPIACGAARLPIPIYLVGSAIGALTWGYVFTLLGWGFGETTLLVLGHVKRYEKYLVLIILLVSIVALMIMRRRHVENKAVEVIASGDVEPPPKLSE
jgi:membrane protein DedA with SNARE-associated domain